MGHFVISKKLEVQKSSQTAQINSIENENKDTKFQHRCEFYWWEQFRCLGHKGVAVPLSEKNENTGKIENIIGILDVEKCLTDEKFTKSHSAYTGQQFNWIFEASEYLEDLKFIVVNSEGIFFIKHKDDDDDEIYEIDNPY